MPAETSSSAVITRFTPSFTPHGVIGVRVRLYFISNYVQLNFFLDFFSLSFSGSKRRTTD
jgi:hypothetical protein